MKKNKFRIIRPKLSDEGSDYEPSNPSPVWTIPEPSKSYEPSNGGPVWTIPKPSKSKSLPKTRLADSLPKSKGETCKTCNETFEWRASYLKHLRYCNPKLYAKPKSVADTQIPASSTSKPFGLGDDLKTWREESSVENVRLTKRRELISKLEIKQEIVEEAKVVNNNAQVARKHGLSQDTIQYWCKNEDNINTTLKKLRPYEVPSRRDAQSYVQMPSPSPPTLGFLEGDAADAVMTLPPFDELPKRVTHDQMPSPSAPKLGFGLGGTLKNLRKEHSFHDNSKIIDDIRGKSKTYVSRTSLDNNANDTEKKKFNLENTVLGIHKNKTAPTRLISAHLIYSNQEGLQIMFSGDAVQELTEDQLAYVQQECINQTSKLQSEALEQGLVPPTKIEIELL